LDCGPVDNGYEILLGFNDTESTFAATTTICFDGSISANLYSIYLLAKETVARDHDNNRPSFK
jgi:hypothetical protein